MLRVVVCILFIYLFIYLSYEQFSINETRHIHYTLCK